MLDWILHVDARLTELVASQGPLTYLILFLIIFAETGLVVTPFLPGDSLLFAAGALAATGALRVEYLLILTAVAAVLGNTVNYAVGRRIAHLFALDMPDRTVHKWVKREYVQRAHQFFARHGGKAVVLARFVPIVRTFLPFVAGGAGMPYGSFTFYNVVGCVAWIGICVMAGYAFGNIPVVKANFEIVVLAIVGVSVLPIVIEVARGLRSRPRRAS
jgi:membrane-associated protein